MDGQPLQSEWETDTFTLKATYHPATNILHLHLQDYANGVVYEKKYKERDIGSKIDSKLEIFDVYSVFTPGTKKPAKRTSKKPSIK